MPLDNVPLNDIHDRFVHPLTPQPLGLMASGGLPAPRQTRGFLNCNPGNMDRAAGEPWQGEIRDPNDARLTDFQRHELTAGRFCVFTSAEWGVRGIAKQLWAYERVFNARTIRDYINRWAPPNENNTEAYIARVSVAAGVDADAPVDIHEYRSLRAVVEGIINVECAGMPYSGSEIEDGLRLAGVVKPVGVTTSRTAAAGTVASTATVGTAALSAFQEPIQQVSDQLAPFAGTNHVVDQVLLYAKLALAAIALIGVGIMIYERVKRSHRDAAIDANPTLVGQ